MAQYLEENDVAWNVDARNVLNKRASFQAHEHFTHANILAKSDPGIPVKHVVSNLVRAMDTLFFSVYPSLREGLIPSVTSTSYIQEVGKGWDGSMHQSRMTCDLDGDDEIDFNDEHEHEEAPEEGIDSRFCTKVRHFGQIERYRDLAQDPDSPFREAFTDLFGPGDGLHKQFYDNLELYPTTDQEYFSFQMKNNQRKVLKVFNVNVGRSDKDTQERMFEQFLQFVATSDEQYLVVAGHSHYFAHMVKHVGKNGPDAPKCKRFGKAMQHNGAVWRVTYDTTSRVITNCKIVYGRFKTMDNMDDDMNLDMPLELEQTLGQLEADLASILSV
jgi:hypothetical protein